MVPSQPHSPVQEYITTDSFTIDITERELEFLFGMKLFYQILPKLKLFLYPNLYIGPPAGGEPEQIGVDRGLGREPKYQR